MSWSREFQDSRTIQYILATRNNNRLRARTTSRTSGIMTKRIGTKRSNRTRSETLENGKYTFVPPQNDIDDEDNVDDSNIHNVVVGNTNIFDELRQSLSNEFLPLINDDHNGGDINTLSNLVLFDNTNHKERKEIRQRLLLTSTKLFRYIEQLASMEGRLQVALDERRERQHVDDNDGDVEENKLSSEQEEDVNIEPCGLSGLPSLYVGENDGEDNVDAETIWGQVDMQNSALIAVLKKQLKNLTRKADCGTTNIDDDEMIRILHMDGGSDDTDDDNDESDDDESDDDDDDEVDEVERNFFADEYDSDNDDTEVRNIDELRIRERMERAMAEMEDDDDDDDRRVEGPLKTPETSDDDRKIYGPLKTPETSDDDRKIYGPLKTPEGSGDDDNDDNDEGDDSEGNAIGEGVDSTREEMLDGFFDLHEMEAFADEEEEMLPDDAFGEEENADNEDENGGGKSKQKKNKKGMLPHLRDRLGDASESDEESDDDYDDREEEDPLSKRFQPTTIRRKKYRDEDEVEALYKMYEGGEANDDGGIEDDDDEAADVSMMTAADLFGKPSKTLMKKYKAQAKLDVNTVNGGKRGKDGVKGKKKKVESFQGDNDDDSWDNHNFEDDGVDWKEDNRDDNDEDGDDADKSEDEEEPMNDEDNDNINHGKRKLSPHEAKSQKLQQQTERLEQDMMAEKPWKMMGEAKGTNRSVDSLLDSTPEFEVAFKPPPILTPQHAIDIEEMIKKRIVDEDWDDVVPRELPDIGLHKRGNGEAPDVSQEKSKLGLGELYEREYLKKTVGYDRTADERQTEEDAAKDEMKRLFANLCSQLDALSNYHFAPRPVADEADVRNREDVPAIAMEEVLPLHVSRSRGIAPEEVHAAGKGRQSVLKGDSELDQAERKRLRSAKKAARRKTRQQKHADEKLISKLQPGLGLNNPYEKRKLREELQMARASGKVVVASDNKGKWKDEAAAGKEYQTSTKFFAKMQDNVESMVHGGGGDDSNGRAKKKRKGLDAGQQSSSVYKL